jgi:DNA-directed RNA polymerase beta' subunit
MKLETIINKLHLKFPGLFIVYTPENAAEVIIRCYIKQSMIKKDVALIENYIVDIMKTIRSTVIRGVNGIYNVNVVDMPVSTVDPETGEIKNDSMFAIETDGSNTSEILKNSYIDVYNTQTDSIQEFARIFGIAAAQNKIVNEMQKVMDLPNSNHATVYAAEMCWTGAVTSLRSAGLAAREASNIGLQLSFQSQNRVIENTSSNGYVDKISGMASSMILGQPIKMGTQYNSIIVNENYVSKSSKNLSRQIMDEL